MMTKRRMHRLWALVQEPRSVTLTIAGFVYGPAVVVGAWWVLTTGVMPTTLRDWSAVLLIVGGIIGALGAIPGEWALERVGIVAMVSGWSAHLAVTMTYPGLSDRWDETVTVALIASLCVRFMRTWGIPRNPVRRSER